MVNRNVITVIDGEAGSCGKAKVIGEIATDKNIPLGASVTNCMPNAGHTFVDGDFTHVFRNIPVAIVNPNVDLFIGSGSVIDFETFKEEYDKVEHLLGKRKIYVHSLVPLVEERHKALERELIKSGSTYKGCGAAIRDKIIRDPHLQFFPGYKNAIPVSPYDWLDLLYKHLNNKEEFVLLEGAQGCDLSLNFSNNHPFVTSRNVSNSHMLDDSGISPKRFSDSVMVIRPFPIRISNITNDKRYIYTGNYGTAMELTWTQINIAAKCGIYPSIIDDDFFQMCRINLTEEIKKKLVNESTDVALMQVLKDRDSKDLTILDALELERLMNKRKSQRLYKSEIIDFSAITKEEYIEDLSENTSVTKMERRIFDLDIQKLKYNVLVNDPSGLYLNFFEHLDLSYAGAEGNIEDIYLNRYLREYLNYLEDATNTELLALGTGKNNGERIKIKELVNLHK